MISYFCSSKKQHTRWPRDLSSDVCSSDLDLFINVMNVMGVQLTEVHITRLEAGTFYAELVLSTGEHVDARPSDAIALRSEERRVGKESRGRRKRKTSGTTHMQHSTCDKGD